MSKVTESLYRWDSSNLPLIDSNPVCCGEPLVILDIIDAVLQVAVPLGQVHLQQVPQQVLQVGREVTGEPHLRRRALSDETVGSFTRVAKRNDQVCHHNI